MAKEDGSGETHVPAAVDAHLESRRGRYEEKHQHIRGRGLISSSALGLSDGLVTNLAFLTGFGAGVGVDLIKFAGVAAMFAGAVSMFFGGVLSARSELDLFKADSNREAYEIEHERDEELTELTDLYKDKGLTKEEAEMVVTRVSSNKDRFLEDMLANELHIHRANLQNPLKMGAVIGMSFLVGALVPLVPYYVAPTKASAVLISVVLSLSFLFAAGAWKGVIVQSKLWKSGLETMLVGAAATAILYVIGTAFEFV